MATGTALALLSEIVADHDPVLLYQSGECCDGSPPMCYPQGELLIGDSDALPGHIAVILGYIGCQQFELN